MTTEKKRKHGEVTETKIALQPINKTSKKKKKKVLWRKLNLVLSSPISGNKSRSAFAMLFS